MFKVRCRTQRGWESASGFCLLQMSVEGAVWDLESLVMASGFGFVQMYVQGAV